MKSLLTFVACLLCAASTFAADPTTKPSSSADAKASVAAAAPQDEFVTTPMRVQEFPARTYFYYSLQTTLAQIAPVADEAMHRLHQTMDDNNVKPQGAPILIYKGLTGDPNKVFELQVGCPVADGTKEAGDAKVRQLEAFKAATILYSGPIKDVHEAWQGLFKDLFESGLQYTGEMRDTFFEFTAMDSPNNVQRMSAGVK